MDTQLTVITHRCSGNITIATLLCKHTWYCTTTSSFMDINLKHPQRTHKYLQIYLQRAMFHICLSWGFYCCDKQHDQNNFDRKELISLLLPNYNLASKAFRAETWRSELMWRPWTRVAFWLAAPHGLPSLFFLLHPGLPLQECHHPQRAGFSPSITN